MALYEWSDEYSVSVSRFDADHRNLFKVINELNDAMAEGRGTFAVSISLSELNEYARRHFAAEEEAMRRAGYDGLEEHVAEHRRFTAKIKEFYLQYNANVSSVPIELLYYLGDWLENHVLKTDRQYMDAMQRSGIR